MTTETYTVEAKCTNCGWKGGQTFEKGIQTNQTNRECPACGCRALTYGNLAELSRAKK